MTGGRHLRGVGLLVAVVGVVAIGLFAQAAFADPPLRKATARHRATACRGKNPFQYHIRHLRAPNGFREDGNGAI